MASMMLTIENHPVFSLISSQEEVDQLAKELAEDYAEYFNVDTSQEQEKYQDAIEECLAHLEEVSSALDDLKPNGATIDSFVAIVASKSETLNKLFAQVDAIEQYLYETSRLLDQLEGHLLELERHQSSKASRIKQIIGKIPGMSNMPRLGILSGLSNLIYDNGSSSFVGSNISTEDHQLQPIEGLLDKIQKVELAISSFSINLNKRLQGDVDLSATQPELNESMATLSMSSAGNVDGSWQELL